MAYAQDPSEIPVGSSAEVIEGKIREEGESQLVDQSPPELLDVDLEKSTEAKPKEVRFILNKVHLKGDILIEKQRIKDVLDSQLGQSVTFRDLRTLASRVESLYRADGYFAVVFTPPQEIQNGEVTLQVIVSKMGELTIEGLRYFKEGKTKSYWRIPAGGVLDYQTINEGIMAMNDNPDRKVKPLLRAGKEQGTTDVILKAKENFPIHAGFSLDNQGVKLTGKERVGFNVRHNNLLGLDDIFIIGTVFGTEFGALYLNHLIPVNKYGTRVVWGFSHAQVNPKKEFFLFGINGISQTYSMSVRHKIFRDAKKTGDVYFGLDLKEKRTRIQSGTSVRDRLRVFKLGANIKTIDQGGVWAIDANMSASFSPLGDGNPLASRQAESQFTKYNLSLTRHQKLPLNTKAIVRFQTQVSPDKLPPQEQMFLGGANTVRGYPESDYGADQAVFGSVEYHVPAFMIPKDLKLPRMEKPLRDHFTGVVFLDYGYGQVRDPSSNESRTRNLLGAGGGVHVRLTKHLSGQIEWGYALNDQPLTEGGRKQFHFRLAANI